MKANVKEVWIIAECPNCHRPQTINFWVTEGMAIDITRERRLECDRCGHGYQLQVREMDTRLPVT